MQSALSNPNFQSDVDLSVVKLVSFIAIAVISAGFAGYFIATIDILYALISMSVFWIIFTLQVLFIKGRGKMLIALSLESMAIAVPSVFILESSFSGVFLIAIVSLFTLLLWAEIKGKREVSNSLKIQFFKVARISLSKSIPAILVFLSILYIFVASKDIVAKNGEFVADSIIAPLFSSFIPGISSDSSFRDIIEKTAELRLGKEAYENLPSYVKDESVKQTQDFIERYTGDIDIDAPFSDVIYEFFTNRLGGADFYTKLYIAITLLALAWFVINTLAMILYLPIAIFAFVIYELLIVTNFITIQYESRSKEIILLN